MSFNKYPVYLTRYKKERPTHGSISQGIVDEKIGKTCPGAVVWNVSSFKAIVDEVYNLVNPVYADIAKSGFLKKSHGIPEAEVFDRVFVSVETDESGKFIAPAYVFMNCERTTTDATKIEMVAVNQKNFNPLKTNYSTDDPVQYMNPFMRSNMFDMTSARIRIPVDLILEDYTPFSFGLHQKVANNNRNQKTRDELTDPSGRFKLSTNKTYSVLFIRPKATKSAEDGAKYTEDANGDLLEMTLKDGLEETQFISYDRSVYDLNKYSRVPIEFEAKMGPNAGTIYQMTLLGVEMPLYRDLLKPSTLVAFNGAVERRFFTNETVSTDISAERAKRFITFPVLLQKSPLHSFCFQPYPRSMGYGCIPNRLRNDTTEECTARATMGNSEFGDECNEYYNSLSNGEKSVVIQGICNQDRGLNECDCFSRDQNPAYKLAISDAEVAKQNDLCWYKACSITDRSTWLDPTLMIGASCSVCINMVNLNNLNNVTIGELKQSINCLKINENAAGSGADGSTDAGNLKDAVITAGNTGDLSGLEQAQAGLSFSGFKTVVNYDKKFIAVLFIALALLLFLLYAAYRVFVTWKQQKQQEALYQGQAYY